MLKKIVIAGLFSGILFANNIDSQIVARKMAVTGVNVASQIKTKEKNLLLHCPCCAEKHSNAVVAPHRIGPARAFHPVPETAFRKDRANDILIENLESVEEMKEQMSEMFKRSMEQMNEIMKNTMDYLSSLQMNRLKQINRKNNIKIYKNITFEINEKTLRKVLNSLRNGEKKVIASDKTENETCKIYVKKENGKIGFIFEIKN